MVNVVSVCLINGGIYEIHPQKDEFRVSQIIVDC